MNDLTKLKEVLDNQTERGIESGDWIRLEYKESRDDRGNYELDLDGVKVGFAFSEQGRLLGIYNWQQ